MEKNPIDKGLFSRNPVKAKSEEGPKMNSPRFLSNVYGDVRSRYLGASMGSCHDFCKYRHKYESKDDPKPAIFRRFCIDSDAVQNHVKVLSIGDKMKCSGLKLNESDKSKALQLEKISVSGNPSTIELKIPSLEKNCIEIPRQTILQVSTNDEINLIKVLNSSNNKCQVMKPKDLPESELTPVKKKKPLVSTKITSRGDSFKGKAASYVKETVPSYALKLNSPKKPIASPRFQSENKTVSLPSIKIDGYAKPAINLKARIPTYLSRNLNDSRNLNRNLSDSRNLDRNLKSSKNLNRNLSDSRNLDRNLKSSKILDRKVSKSFNMPEIGYRKFLNLQKPSIHSSTPAHSVARLKTRKFRSFEHAALEKDIECNDGIDRHEIIQIKPEYRDMDVNNDSFNYIDDGSTSESYVSDVTDLSEIEDMKWEKNHKHLGEEREKRIRTQAVQQDGNPSSPYKMKFKKGKVIELAPTESVGPRRLRFRKARVINENSIAEGMKRIVRRRNIGDVKVPGAEAHANSSEVSAVMLKHQDSPEKKDRQALFNYVIEETANKLVEARKSKVKALVGAFETVILLQDIKAAQVF